VIRDAEGRGGERLRGDQREDDEECSHERGGGKGRAPVPAIRNGRC
jgi:hypothetical protein